MEPNLDKYMSIVKRNVKDRIKKNLAKYESKSDGDVSDDDLANTVDHLRLS